MMIGQRQRKGGGGGFGGGLNVGPVIEPGTYNVKLSVNGKDFTTKVVIETDPGMSAVRLTDYLFIRCLWSHR